MSRSIPKPNVFTRRPSSQDPTFIHLGTPSFEETSTPRYHEVRNPYDRNPVNHWKYSADNTHSKANMIPELGTRQHGRRYDSDVSESLLGTRSVRENKDPIRSSRPTTPREYIPAGTQPDDEAENDVTNDEWRYQQPAPTIILPPTTFSNYLDGTAHDVKPYVPESLHSTGRYAIDIAKQCEQSVRSRNPRLSSRLSSIYSGASDMFDRGAHHSESIFSSKNKKPSRHRHPHSSQSGVGTDLALLNMNVNTAAADESSTSISNGSAPSIAGGDTDPDAGSVFEACASCLSGIGDALGCIASFL